MDDLLRKVVNLPLEEQAKRCDIMTAHNVINPSPELDRQMMEATAESFPVWNSTSVGNVARTALSHPNPKVRDKTRSLLDEYIKWYNSSGGICVIS